MNGEHLRALPIEELAAPLTPFFIAAGFTTTPEKILAVAPLIRERIRLFSEAPAAADFFFLQNLLPTIQPSSFRKRGTPHRQSWYLRRHSKFYPLLPSITTDWTKPARSCGIARPQSGAHVQPIRVAVCGRKNAPPLFETMTVLGRDTTLERIGRAEKYTAVKVYRLDTEVSISVSGLSIKAQSVPTNILPLYDDSAIRTALKSTGLVTLQEDYAVQKLKTLSKNEGFFIPVD